MRAHLVCVFAAAALLTACPAPSDSDPIVDSGVVDVDAGVDAGVVDSGTRALPCEGDAGCRVVWTELGAYPAVVDHHTSFVLSDDAGAHLFVAGGFDAINSIAYKEVRRAPIQPNGLLGPWELDTNIERPIAFHGQATQGGRIYLLGGVSHDPQGPFASARTYVGELGGDGKLTWRRGGDLPGVALHPTAAAVGDKLFLIGGTGAGNAVKADVLVASIASDGLHGTFTATLPLPEPRSHHMSFVRDGHIYVLGGFTTNNVPLPGILRSEHDASGAITEWKNIGSMVDPPWTSAATVVNDSVILVGGGEGATGQETYVSRVRRAKILADGTLSAFEDLADLPVARAHVHHAPVFNHRIYSVGGRLLIGSGESMDRAFVGDLY